MVLDEWARKNNLRGELDSQQSRLFDTLSDFLVAKSWRSHVEEEAGEDYMRAVEWCFEGNRYSIPDSWRLDMFHEVVLPLQRCCDHMCGPIQNS